MLKNTLKEILNAFSSCYKLISSRASDILLTSFTTVPADQGIVTVSQNASVVSTCTDSIATTVATTTVSTSTVSTALFSGICNVQSQDTAMLQHRTNLADGKRSLHR